jgi:hypothetical protein
MKWVLKRTAVDVDGELATCFADAHDAGQSRRCVELEDCGVV